MKKLILILMLLTMPIFAQRGFRGGFQGERRGGYSVPVYPRGPRFRFDVGFGGYPYYFGQGYYPYYPYYAPPVVVAPPYTPPILPTECKTVDIIVDGQHVAGRVCKDSSGRYGFSN